MEAEERPSKKRRLSSEVSTDIKASVGPTGFDVYNDERPVSNVDPEIHEGLEHTTKINLIGNSHDNPDAEPTDCLSLDRSLEKTGSEPQLSKNQSKKLKRQQEWEAGRTARRAKRKVKIQEKKARKREQREEGALSGSRHNIDCPDDNVVENTTKHPHRKSVQLPITFVLDCGFDDLMHNKERISLAAQLTRCYSDNHHAPFKAHMAISSFEGLLKERFDTVLSKHHENWKNVKFLDGDFIEAVAQAKEWMTGDQGGVLAGALALHPASDLAINANPAEEESEVVYLTSDSPFTLTTLKPHSTYIIGGLVDRNRHKGICYQRALDRGLKTAKLPIGEYMEMTSRFVLATNHVAEIMLRWLECGDWAESFLKVVPKRKGGVLKERKAEGEEGSQVKDIVGKEDQRTGEKLDVVAKD